MALSRGRLRDRDGQLQPGDGVDRLRHQRPAVLRAAHARGRARGRARRAAGRPGRRRHLPARRADPARPRAGARGRGRADRGHVAGRDPPGRGARRVRPGARPAPGCPRPSTAWPPRSTRRSAIAAEIGYPVLVRPSYVLGGRGMEIVYDDAALRRATSSGPPRSARSTRCSSTGSSTTRSRSTSTRIYDGTDLFLGGVMEHIEEAGIHSGDSSCALPPITLGAQEITRIREATDRDRGGRRRARPAQRAVRPRLRRALRPRGQPAGQPDRAVRVQGDRDPAGQRGRPGDARRDDRRPAHGRGAARRGRRRRPAGRRADRGQGGGDAVQPVPHPRRPQRRHRARPGDEVDRRGDGLRRRLRHRLRQGADRGVRVAADQRQGVRVAWPTATSAR